MANATHGVGVPAARAVQGRRAGIVTRTAANVVDAAIAVSVVVGGYLAWCAVTFLIRPRAFTFPAPPTPVLSLCWAGVLFAYFTISWAATGRTYGDHLLGLRVVNARGGRMSWSTAVARSAFCVTVPIGLYWALVSSTNKSLQDAVLRTCVRYDWTTPRPAPPRAAATQAGHLPRARTRGTDADPPPVRSRPDASTGGGQPPR